MGTNFGFVDAHDHQRGRSPLDGLGHVLTDAHEGVGALLLHLGRQHLDFDARELLGQRFTKSPAARRLLTGEASQMTGYTSEASFSYAYR